MFSVGSTYWNMVHGRLPGDVLQDGEGINNMRKYGICIDEIEKGIQ